MTSGVFGCLPHKGVELAVYIFPTTLLAEGMTSKYGLGGKLGWPSHQVLRQVIRT